MLVPVSAKLFGVGLYLFWHRGVGVMTWPFGLLRPSTYGAIYADPASKFRGYTEESSGVPQRAAEQHYQTMTFPEMADLPVARLAAPDCALFMWSTSAQTANSFWLAAQWGFKFSSKAFCWAKLNPNVVENFNKEPSYPFCDTHWSIGMGHGTRRNTEDCWLFMRGQPKRLDRGVRELIVAPRREHSRKPDDAYARIERLVAGPYCELFSRTNRPGWSSWGNEAGKFE